MTERNRVAPRYRGLVSQRRTAGQPQATDAASETQAELNQMSTGERWVQQAAGGIDNRTDGENGPQ